MLYISNGVPIYPHCLGHSYQTMTWRMNVEARSIEQENSEIVANLSESKNFLVSLTPPLDEFYLRRYEARTNDEDYNPNLSFLEEKCLFYKRKAANKDGYDVRESSLERQQSLTASALVRQDNESASGQNGASLHRPYDLNPSHSSPSNSPHSLPPRSMPSSSLSNDAHLYSWPRSDRPTQSIRIHRHLADKHLLGRPAINDQGGKMRTAPLSLSANFSIDNIYYRLRWIFIYVRMRLKFHGPGTTIIRRMEDLRVPLVESFREQTQDIHMIQSIFRSRLN